MLDSVDLRCPSWRWLADVYHGRCQVSRVFASGEMLSVFRPTEFLEECDNSEVYLWEQVVPVITDNVRRCHVCGSNYASREGMLMLRLLVIKRGFSLPWFRSQ